jgi:hypothetical protein
MPASVQPPEPSGSRDGAKPAFPSHPSTQNVVDHLVQSWLPAHLPDAKVARLMASALSRPYTVWVAQMKDLPLQASVVQAVTWVLTNGDVTIRAVSPPCVSSDIAWGLASAQLMALARFVRIRRLRVGYPQERLARIAADLAQPQDSASPFWRAAQKLQADLPEVSWHFGTET